MKMLEKDIIRIIRQNFNSYKVLADRTFVQLSEQNFHYKPDETANSVAIIIKHMNGNLKSRFTDFFTTDGEKPDRNRDMEFNEDNSTKGVLLNDWENSWKILFDLMNTLTPEDLSKKITIRTEEHSVLEALNRQVAHYAYHVGQIVFLGKLILKEQWINLSIARGKSQEFNNLLNKSQE